MEKLKKITALFLAAALLLPLLPSAAWATEMEEITVEVAETADTEAEATEEDALVEEASAEEAVAEEDAPEEEVPAEEPAAGDASDGAAAVSDDGIMLASTVIANGECGDNVYWTLDGDGTFTVSGTGKMTDYMTSGWDGTPEWLEDDYGDFIEKVVVKSGVTSIGSWTFYGSAVTSVKIADTVTSIGKYAFYECSFLTSVTIPATVKSIGSKAFGYNTDWSGNEYVMSNFVIYGYSGSAAETYAKNNGITFVSLGSILSTPSVTLSNASAGVTVKWSKVSGASGYYVYRKTSGGTFSKIATITSGSTVSYTDTAVKSKSGTTYYYTVRAYKGSTMSGYVSNQSIVRLSQPTVSVSNVSTGVKVSWGKVTGASGYYVYRKTSGGTFSKIATITSGSTVSYTDKTAKSGTTYYYTVRAYKGSTLSSYVTNKTIKYLTAGKVSSLTNTASGITVKWSKITGASGYNVYRKVYGGSYSKIATVTGNSTVSYTDTAVKSKNGTTYVYAVRPYSGSTLGSYTGKTTVRLTTPTFSSVTNSASKKMTVKWTAVSGVTGYLVEYSTSSDFSNSMTISSPLPSDDVMYISDLTKGKTYYVRMRTYKTVSGTKYYSGWSSTKSVKISK